MRLSNFFRISKVTFAILRVYKIKSNIKHTNWLIYRYVLKSNTVKILKSLSVRDDQELDVNTVGSMETAHLPHNWYVEL
jgi:hypothetical protein